MQGDTGEQAGIMPRVFSRIFDAIHQSSDVEYLIRVSYLELYNEEIRDLFDKNSSSRLELKENRENSVYVKNLRTVVVENATDMMKVLTVRAKGHLNSHDIVTVPQIGAKNRSVGQTLMNTDSSRSHSVFTITIESSTKNTQSVKKPLFCRVKKLVSRFRR